MKTTKYCNPKTATSAKHNKNTNLVFSGSSKCAELKI